MNVKKKNYNNFLDIFQTHNTTVVYAAFGSKIRLVRRGSCCRLTTTVNYDNKPAFILIFFINSIGEPAYFTLFKEFTRLQKLSELFVPFNTRSYECL